MDRHTNSKASLFLMELIIAIFFFSIAAAVCVRLFFSAHSLAEKTVSLNNAITWSQNLAEAFCGEKGEIESISQLYPDAFATQDTLILFFDDKWESISDELTDASYEAIIVTHTARAGEVYSDVVQESDALIGSAIVGEIAILDLRDTPEVISKIPEDGEKIILRNTVDYYLGKENNGE